MPATSNYNNVTVKIYHGYGHTHDLVVYGHIFLNNPFTRKRYTNHLLSNGIHLLRLFFIKPLADAIVELKWKNQTIRTKTEKDGFFKFEWKSDSEVSAGWHPVEIHFLLPTGQVLASGTGKIFVPHKTQFAYISDIDDTVLISYSATKFKRLRVLFSQNPHTRKSFDDVINHYKLLAYSFTIGTTPNPFFYVSSSEWNLYDDLIDFFNYNKLPEGVFLLSSVKRWFQLFKTGKTKHEAKLLKIIRILETFPLQRFILFGDNSQSDPSIYQAIVRKYPGKIFAVYIRNIFFINEKKTEMLLHEINQLGPHTCLFNNNVEALEHSRKIGLIE
jgi:phosphatidate phosphatase APP1